MSEPRGGVPSGSELESLRRRVSQLEGELRALESHKPDAALLSVASNSPDIVTILDRDLKIRYISRVRDPHCPLEVIGSSVLDFFPETFARSVRETFESVAANREPGGYQSESVTPDGQVTYWENVVGGVVKNGEVVGFTTIARDITETRRQVAAQERFFLLSIDMLCLASFEGYFIRVNPSFSRVLGFSPEELLSRPILSFVVDEDQSRTIEAFEALFQGEAVIDFENRYRRSDGQVRWISWRAASDPERREIYAVARDVTEMKQLEAQLRQSQKLEALGQLAGGIAHDFNNLILAIRSNVLFARGLPDGDFRRHAPLDMIDEASLRAEGLVQQLLSFTELRPAKRELFDFEQRTREVLGLVGSLLPPGITTRLAVAPDAPVRIYGDASQLEQVVMNLCLNARDALPDGGEIQLRFERPSDPPGRGDWLRLLVIDEGTGMPDQVSEHLFEPFFTTKEQGKGTGLGLSTVYGIVRQHGGRIGVESELGVGTTFRVDFPVGSGAVAKEPVQRDAGEAIRGNETLLVAEDEELVRRVLERILETAGYTVIFAVDGVDALELFRAHRDEIALVLLDHVMPGRTGVEVLAAIREAGSDVPVLISSGFRKRSGAGKEPEGPEPDAFLSKPFQPPELLALVRRLLDARAPH